MPLLKKTARRAGFTEDDMFVVLMDLDDTLFDFAAAEKQALSATLCGFGIAPRKEILERYSAINGSLWRAMERGEVGKEVLVVERFRRLFAEFALAIAPEKAQESYERNLCDAFPLLAGARELLVGLSQKYAVYAASNGTRVVQTSRLEKSGLRPLFRGVFLSEEVGAAKPRKEYFDFVFRHIAGACPKKTVLVGDSLSSDVKGAANAGIRSVWYNPKGKERGDAPVDIEVRALSEIPAAIEKAFLKQ